MCAADNDCLDCISFEQLSAWIDGESELTGSEKKHIENCKECQKLEEDLRLISLSLKREMEKPISDDLVNSFLCVVHKDIPENSRSSFPGYFSKAFTVKQWILRIAAVLFLAVIFVILWRDQNKFESHKLNAENYNSASRQMSTRPAVLRAALIPTDYVSYSISAGESYTNNPLEVNGNGSFFGVYDSNPYSSGTVRSDRFRPAYPARVPMRLCQIWISDTFEAEQLTERVQLLAKELKVPKNKIDLKKVDNTLSCYMTLDARQTVLFMKQLKEWGFISFCGNAQSLQDQNFFQGNGSQKISYHVQFICPARTAKSRIRLFSL